MSKKQNPVPLGTPMDGRVIYHHQISELEGKILTLIESLGLKEKQEESVKNMFRDVFYRIMYYELEYLGGIQINNAIQDWVKENGERGQRTLNGS
jgi:hypothetical protein